MWVRCADRAPALAKAGRWIKATTFVPATLGFTLVNVIPGPEDHPHTIAHGPWQAALYERKIRTGRGLRAEG
jgi:hypothetical protein